jgi:hypothetical protein
VQKNVDPTKVPKGILTVKVPFPAKSS